MFMQIVGSISNNSVGWIMIIAYIELNCYAISCDVGLGLKKKIGLRELLICRMSRTRGIFESNITRSK